MDEIRGAVTTAEVSAMVLDRIDCDLQKDYLGHLTVCLCDVEPTDQMVASHGLVFTNCDKHTAAKLQSLGGLKVLVHVQDKDGNIVPITAYKESDDGRND